MTICFKNGAFFALCPHLLVRARRAFYGPHMRTLKTPLLAGILFFGPALVGAPFALAQEPLVRLWTPFHDNSSTFACLKAELADWQEQVSEAMGAAPIPHHLVELPEGKYSDQITAALNTGEQPHILMLETTRSYVLPKVKEGYFFGADVLGIWVDQQALSDLAQGDIGFSGLWLGDTATAFAALDEFLLLLKKSDRRPLGIDLGPRGDDLGLGLALMVEQWTRAFDDPSAPDWNSTEVAEVFDVIDRWQQEGLLGEVEFGELLRTKSPLPIMTIARYSAGRTLGGDFAFYPMFSSVEGRPASFLELPVYWHDMREGEAAFSKDLLNAIARGDVFETCAESAGYLSYQQLIDQSDFGPMNLFFDRQGDVLPEEVSVEMLIWTGQDRILPTQLSNVLRDMRAGLSVHQALDALR